MDYKTFVRGKKSHFNLERYYAAQSPNTNPPRKQTKTYVPRTRRKKQVTFATLLKRIKTHKKRHNIEEPTNNSNRRTLPPPQKVRLDRTWKVMNESDVRCFLRKRFEGQGNERGGVAACRKCRDLSAWKVVDADWAFFTSSARGNDST